MPKLLKRRSTKAGLPPGTLTHLGERRVDKATVTVIDYDATSLEERMLGSAAECREFVGKSTVTWINVTGLHDADVMGELGRIFDLHPLLLEDVMNTSQRPMLEDYGKYISVVLKMIYREPESRDVVTEQVSLVLGPDYVISFQEMPGDVFDSIRERIRQGQGRIRAMGCDYLAYTLLDAIVDNYFVVLEDVGDAIEALYDQVLERADPEMLKTIHMKKAELVFMRKSLWPLRELLSAMGSSESELIGTPLRPYLRDVYEHTIQVVDTVESLRDTLGGVLDVYLTTVSNRMNETMKVLTVIATIFIPITFVAGIYGMNFENMPELKWPMGYAYAWSIMGAAVVGMLAYFRRKRWI